MGTIIDKSFLSLSNEKAKKEIKAELKINFFEFAKPRIITDKQIDNDRIKAYKFLI